MSLEILPLTPDRLSDLAALFEQGGDPKWCWCAYFRVRGRDWTNSTGAENRAVLTQAVEEDAADDRHPGLVAYVDGTAAGWVSVGPREDYERLVFSKILAPVDDRPVWSIVCFVVGRRHRGHGVANALLTAAVDYAREHGATMLEAYPADLQAGERIPAANAYQGTIGMFRRAGFDEVDRRRAPGATRDRPIVRLAL